MTAVAFDPLPELVNERDLAALIGVSQRQIRELAHTGIFQRRARGGYSPTEAVPAYCARLRAIPAKRAPDTAHREARTRVATEQAEKLALQNAVLRGEMIPASRVEAEWASVVREIRAAMLALPARLQLRMGFTADEVETIDREIRDALTEAAGNAP